MRLLYLSCHSILEFDELSLFTEIGIDVFSLGAYIQNEVSPDDMRPPIAALRFDSADMEAFHKLANAGQGDSKDRLSKEFVDRFDAVMIMHCPQWVQRNWEVMCHKPIILRTIGQSTSGYEQMIGPYRRHGLKIVRYSPMERNIPFFCGADAFIRFGKDPQEFRQWNGQERYVITLCQSMPNREQACNFKLCEQITRPFPRKLYGPGNEQAGDYAVGKVDYDELKRALRDHRAYCYTGTHPASYTLNFIEAWMTGIPVVAIGGRYGNPNYLPNHNKLYEVPELIVHGVNGFCSDSVDELRTCIHNLLEDDQLAADVSAAGRQSAIEHFGRDRIAAQWESFLRSV